MYKLLVGKEGEFVDRFCGGNRDLLLRVNPYIDLVVIAYMSYEQMSYTFFYFPENWSPHQDIFQLCSSEYRSNHSDRWKVGQMY